MKLKGYLRAFTTADILLVVLLSALALGLFLHQRQQNANAWVVAYANNAEVARRPLHQDGVYEINSHCTMQIADGKVRMLRSDCHNQICVKQGWSSSVPIICVPNKVLIRIESKKQKLLITH